MLRSLQLNNREWQVHFLSEQAILCTLSSTDEEDIRFVQATGRLIDSASFPWLQDVVASYDSIAVFYDNSQAKTQNVLERLEQLTDTEEIQGLEPATIRIPVCYDLGMDWEDVSRITGLSKREVIDIHQSSKYSVALIGFMPGFAYLSGMDERLACPRRDFPRVRVPQGSIGIGGEYSGIYSFSCPGGWQIIGQTPVSLFDINRMPLSAFSVGDDISFYEISEETFHEMHKEADK